MTATADRPSANPKQLWSPLGHPLFRAVWIASVASHVGSYMTDVGHERVSVTQQEVERRLQELARKGTSPVIRHFIAPTTSSPMSGTVDAVEERSTGCCPTSRT